MDKILNLAEKNELMDLLGLDRGSWGDLNAMQQSYRQKCRIFHPDKGGDGEKMKRLTSLFQTAMDNLTSTRTGRKTMENVGLNWDIITVPDMLGLDKFDAFLLKNFTCFTMKKNQNCSCLFCILRQQHAAIKLKLKAPCLLWGQCFCYYCFQEWFGISKSATSFSAWKMQVANIHVDLLCVWSEIVKARFSDW
ncbi:Small T antigen [Grifec polyomavirus GB3]|nr:Small T antigen [Grifec polyomavirus GB3]